jgi:hypothetical protein
LLYTTLIGSNDSDTALSIQVDDQGNVYATALVFEDNFPTKNALWAHPPEYWQNSVIFKLNQNGELVYSTYLPLDVFDARQNLAVDGNGNAYVTGSALIFSDEPPFLGSQIAALKLNPNGSQVLLNTHIGDTQTESGRAIDIDANGNIYLAGTTEGGEGNGFPTTTNAHQSTCGDVVYDPQTYCFEDGVVVVLNAAGQVTYSSYHGGSFTDEPTAIATDGQGHVLIAGNTTSAQFPLAQPLQSSCPVDTSTENCYQARGFVSVIDINGSTGDLVYSTYLGSTERESNNVILAAAMDSGGTAYVTGYTNGKQFPVANPIQSQLSDNSFCTTFGSERYCFDTFVTVLSPSGGLSFGTYLGASFDEFPYGLALNPSGDIYLTGTTEANDFPVTANAFQATNPLGDDAFLVKIGSGGSNPPPAPGDKRVFLPMVIR